MNSNVAILLGLHAGDGTLYRTNKGLVWELRGNLDEQKFYDDIISPIVFQATEIVLQGKKRTGGKHGCYGVRSCDKRLIDELKHRFPIGAKGTHLKIPRDILLGDFSFKLAFLKGLFATDGTAYLARINGNSQATYPIIEFSSISKTLRNQVSIILNENGIGHYVWSYTSKKSNEQEVFFLRIAGKSRTGRFMATIGLLNPKHAHRFKNSNL